MSNVLTVREADLSRNEQGEVELAWLGDARPEAVAKVLAADTGTGDGKSRWFWVRVANGDLFLAVAPQGATYEDLEGEPGTGWGE